MDQKATSLPAAGHCPAAKCRSPMPADAVGGSVTIPEKVEASFERNGVKFSLVAGENQFTTKV